MVLAGHVARLVLREPRRALATGLGVAIAASLLMSVLLFGSASGTTVTRRALADLPIDAQVVLAPGADPTAAGQMVTSDPAVVAALPFALAHFDQASVDKSGAATQTSSGVIVGIDAAYTDATRLFAISAGSTAPGAVTISRDLASNLGAVPGDTVPFVLPGGASVSLRVAGITTTAGADLLLGPTDAAHRASGANPPANVAVIDRASLESLVLARIPPGAVASGPGAGAGGATASPAPVSAAEPAVRRELHLRLDHGQLPGDPTAAQAWLDGVRRRIERQGAGAFQVVDDAGATLAPLASDLVWGQILFVFLALPGMALALALSRLAADTTAESTRRHAALLRARGATPRQLLAVFIGATAFSALLGAIVGAFVGGVVAFILFPSNLAAVGAPEAIGRAGVVTVLVTAVLATAGTVWPLRAQLRSEVMAGRQELARVRPAIWQRVYLDVIALGVAVLLIVVFGGTSLHPVLNAEGNPTVTLALSSFAAPFLAWTGGTLLLLRLLGRVMQGSGRLHAALGRLLGPGGELASRTLAARAVAASRAVVVLALAVSFGTSVLVFEATYRQQQRVDAELTLGADLKMTPPAAADANAVTVVRGPGVASATPFADRVVYVGAEAQDLLAVDPGTLAGVAPLSDTFFQGTTAAGAMDALRSQPDAILVSAETAKDYSIVPGDRLRIRIPDAAGALRQVDFHMAGVALEFPTAPKDAFLVANLAYVAAQTGDSRIAYVLARADGDVGAAARIAGARLGSGWMVSDLSTTAARLANSITSVDLADLVLLDIGFAVVIASVGVALFLLAGLAERRRELATLEAIGAEPAQLRAGLAGETLVVGVAGLAVGFLTGSLVGFLLLQILAGIFDPPANVPAVPWLALLAFTGAVAAGLAGALLVADRGVARLGMLAALRER